MRQYVLWTPVTAWIFERLSEVPPLGTLGGLNPAGIREGRCIFRKAK